MKYVILMFAILFGGNAFASPNDDLSPSLSPSLSFSAATAGSISGIYIIDAGITTNYRLAENGKVLAEITVLLNKACNHSVLIKFNADDEDGYQRTSNLMVWLFEQGFQSEPVVCERKPRFTEIIFE